MAGSGKAHLRPAGTALLRVEDLVVEFPVGRTGLKVNAVSGISLDVLEGETLGLVGESGCGKSTTGRAIMQLPRPTSGSVVLEGQDLTQMPGKEIRELRPRMQMIFQDPISSLNPRRKILDIVGEPLQIWKKGNAEERSRKVREVLDTVGIDPDQAGTRKPHEFSGGQCQRICIARSVVMDPKMIICDEPVSALDVSVQAQILNLLEEMKKAYGLTLIFIAHDLAVVKNVSDRVVVMYLGKICEVGPPDNPTPSLRTRTRVRSSKASRSQIRACDQPNRLRSKVISHHPSPLHRGVGSVPAVRWRRIVVPSTSRNCDRCQRVISWPVTSRW